MSMPNPTAALAECPRPALQREHPLDDLIATGLSVGGKIEQLVRPPDRRHHRALESAVAPELIQQLILQPANQCSVIRRWPIEQAARQDTLPGTGRGKKEGEPVHALAQRDRIQKDLIRKG
jgi:hypothetical protein